MESVRPKADASLGWAFRPDEDTVSALASGVKKIRRHPELGADRPHQGGSGNLAEALAKEREKGKRVITRRRRKTMAKKVHRLKEIAARKSGSVKKTVQAAPSKKKTVQAASSNGNLIPLKKLCEQMDLDPKATRVKLRRLIAKGEIDFHDHSQRWEFTPAEAKLVRAALT